MEMCLFRLVGHLQFMVRQRHNPVGHLNLLNLFLVGQKVLRVLCSVGKTIFDFGRTLSFVLPVILRPKVNVLDSNQSRLLLIAFQMK